MSKPDYDVVIAGGGGAGLTAAYRLGSKGYSVLIVDKAPRMGGRTMSGQAGNHYPFNLGTQFFVGAEGPLADLRKELGIPGRFTAMSPLGLFIKGKLIETRSDLDRLWRLPISLSAKISLALNMRKFQSQAFKFYKPGWIAANGERMRELDSQHYSDAIRHIHPEARPFFELLAGDLCANRPEDISSVGGMVSTIALTFGDAFVGEEGNEALHKAMLERSNADVANCADVVDIRSHADHAALTFAQDGREQTVRTRYVVSTLPADIVPLVVKDLPPARKIALGNVIYGPFVSGVFVTREEGDARWRNLAMTVAFDTAFSFVVNQSYAFYGNGAGRPGSVIFGMAVTHRAKALLEKETEEIQRIYRRDMLKIFPEMQAVLEDVIVQKWARGLPGFRPGAYGETALRKAPHGRIYFAGDYTADTTASLRSAVGSAEECAAAIIERLEVEAAAV